MIFIGEIIVIQKGLLHIRSSEDSKWTLAGDSMSALSAVEYTKLKTTEINKKYLLALAAREWNCLLPVKDWVL